MKVSKVLTLILDPLGRFAFDFPYEIGELPVLGEPAQDVDVIFNSSNH